MKVLTSGHNYRLSNFEGHGKEQELQFIHKELKGETLVTIANGTTNEEVIKVLINRINYLDNKFPCKENKNAVLKLEEALMWLDKRTYDRIARDVEGQAKA